MTSCEHLSQQRLLWPICRRISLCLNLFPVNGPSASSSNVEHMHQGYVSQALVLAVSYYHPVLFVRSCNSLSASS